MRDRETIDSELRRVAAELRSIRERGGRPSSQQVDALLDERLGHPVEVLCDTAVLDEILAPFEETFERPRRRRRVRRDLHATPARAATPRGELGLARQEPVDPSRRRLPRQSRVPAGAELDVVAQDLGREARPG